MSMFKKKAAVLVGVVTAGVLAAGSWAGHQERTSPRETEVLRDYDATSVASTAPHTQDVFVGRVVAFEERREIEGWTQDVYRVEVGSVLRGDVAGTVRVTYGLDEGTAPRLADGLSYLFATNAWTDPVGDGHAQLYQGALKPVDDALLATWKAAAALPLVPAR
ncbi:hypothetical protein [Streptomyces termitum]|uniref:hypothetical protein n=1 Tax=Streptomyces termitum TaxID=67368 RepID=UPI0033B612B7